VPSTPQWSALDPHQIARLQIWPRVYRQVRIHHRSDGCDLGVGNLGRYAAEFDHLSHAWDIYHLYPLCKWKSAKDVSRE
jgi:hypothetical protein